jgi:hypothetical protein
LIVNRPIDSAMSQHRPEKETMRRLWAEEVGLVNVLNSRHNARLPLYLTLPGAEGLDIKKLIERQIVRLAENKAIAPEDEWKVVAVESNNSARYELKHNLKGLKVVGDHLESLLASRKPTAWPKGEPVQWCRAHVVNLDLNESLRCANEANGRLVFPTVELISKFAQLHNKDPALDWTLCLTVAAEIHWQPEQCKAVQKFLRENFTREPQFASHSHELLGDRLFEALSSDRELDMTTLNGIDKQALLMVFLPKRIITDTYQQGWKIVTARNLRYGGQDKSQRMVSLIMRFTNEPRVSEEHHTIYSESLQQALSHAGSIDPDGALDAN